MVLHVVRQTAELVRSPYVVVFLASGMPHDAGPTFDFLRLLLEVRLLYSPWRYQGLGPTKGRACLGYA